MLAISDPEHVDVVPRKDTSLARTVAATRGAKRVSCSRRSEGQKVRRSADQENMKTGRPEKRKTGKQEHRKTGNQENWKT